MDEDKLCLALLQYRNTPRKDGLSPVQKLFGRPVQDSIPTHRRSFPKEWQHAAREADQKEVHTREETKYSYNLHARSLPDITVGSHVTIQNPESKMWNIYGTVVDIGPHRRYYVKTHSGRIFVRNRRFLRRRVPCLCPRVTMYHPIITTRLLVKPTLLTQTIAQPPHHYDDQLVHESPIDGS